MTDTKNAHPGDHPGDAGEGPQITELMPSAREQMHQTWSEIDPCDLGEHLGHEAALCPTSAPAGDGAHPDDLAVDRFAAKMKAKLAKARDKGRGGWDDPAQCSPAVLLPMFHEHVAKGDPVDVANFAMMLEHYGASTALSTQATDREKVLEEALRKIANVRPIGGHCHANSVCSLMEGIAARALAQAPSEA